MGKSIQKGLLIVYTGDGKGKSTAAFGTLMRAWGRDLRICVIQFIKAETGKWGEISAAQKMNLEWHTTGDGFTWLSKDMDETTAHALQAWELAKEKISSANYDLVILDEFTYTLQFGWLELKNVLDWLKINRPPEMYLLITGRSAPEELIREADLVTEMRLIKHPFDVGITAQPGIEF
jgi:cob(I)alamin adenosyltransferase